MLAEVASTQAIKVFIPANRCVTLTYVHGAANVKVDINLLFAMSTHTLTWALTCVKGVIAAELVALLSRMLVDFLGALHASTMYAVAAFRIGIINLLRI